jgi:hypothetical protein
VTQCIFNHVQDQRPNVAPWLGGVNVGTSGVLLALRRRGRESCIVLVLILAGTVSSASQQGLNRRHEESASGFPAQINTRSQFSAQPRPATKRAIIAFLHQTLGQVNLVTPVFATVALLNRTFSRQGEPKLVQILLSCLQNRIFEHIKPSGTYFS